MDALTGKNILQMICHLLDVLIGIHSDNKIEMSIYKLLTFTGYNILNILNILNSHLIGWVGNRGMTVFLLTKHSQLTLLIGKKNNLIVNDCIDIRNVIYLTHEVNWHNSIIDSHINIRTKNTWQAYIVNV